MSVGIICEYNPFHNGHLYHIESIKKKFPNEEIILVLSGNYTQRGDISIIEKYDKARIALEYGVDLVVELPFFFVTQGADIFAKGAIEILNYLKCDKLVFGSEINDVESLSKLAQVQINDKTYDKEVKKELDKGINYPTAMANALKTITSSSVSSPNDILALCYIKEIIKLKADITPISIKRTNNYHDEHLNNTISSATSIRKAILEKEMINDFVPSFALGFINKENLNIKYFNLLKYKILSEGLSLIKYQDVDEGIENRILRYISNCNSLEELISNVKSKRYTYSKLKRMFLHILCSFTKGERLEKENISYIKILGFNSKGKIYINKIKKDINIPIITNINRNNINLVKQELLCDNIYNIITNRNDNLFSKKPIIKP